MEKDSYDRIIESDEDYPDDNESYLSDYAYLGSNTYDYVVGGKTITLHENIDDYINGNEIDLIKLANEYGFKHEFYISDIKWRNDDTKETRNYKVPKGLHFSYNGRFIEVNNSTTDMENYPHNDLKESATSILIMLKPAFYDGISSLRNEVSYVLSWKKNIFPVSNLTVAYDYESDVPGYRISRDEAIVMAAVFEFYKEHYEEDVFEEIGFNVREKDPGYYAMYNIY